MCQFMRKTAISAFVRKDTPEVFVKQVRRQQHFNNELLNIISNYIQGEMGEKNSVNGKINSNSDYTGLEAKRSFLSAILS